MYKIYDGVNKKYGVLSREQAKIFTWHEPYIMISVNDPKGKPIYLSEDSNRLNTLYLYFDDTENFAGSDLIPMTTQQAEAVVEFVNGYKGDAKLIVAHCAAGISRSAGVIAAISLYLDRYELPELYKNHVPNTWVKKQIMRALKPHYGMSNLEG